MQYMLLVYGEQQDLSEEARQCCYQEAVRLREDLQAAGKFRAASPLHPVSTATSVRVRDEKRVVTDGPFAETREQLGGYFLVDADDLDDAISIAARIPVARWGTIEIRPVMELGGRPAAGDEAAANQEEFAQRR